MIDDSLFNKWLYSYMETYGSNVIYPDENKIDNEYFVSYETIPYKNKKFIYGNEIEAEPVFHKPSTAQNRYELPAGSKTRRYYLCYAGVPGGSGVIKDTQNQPNAYIGNVTQAAVNFIDEAWRTCDNQTFHVLLFGYLKQSVMKSIVFYSKTVNGKTTDYSLNMELIRNGYATYLPVESGMFIAKDNKRLDNVKYDQSNSNTMEVDTILLDISRAQTEAIKNAAKLTDSEKIKSNIWKVRTNGATVGLTKKAEELSTGDNKIQICSYNVKDFEMRQSDSSNTLGDVSAFIRANDIDICVFIETPKEYSGQKLLDKLNEGITDKNRKFISVKEQAGSNENVTIDRYDAICIVSKYEIASFNYVNINDQTLPDPYKPSQTALVQDGRPMIKATVKINGVTLDIFACHLKSGVGAPDIVDDNDPNYHQKGNMHIRRIQANAYYPTIKQSLDAGNKVVLLGDFNTTNIEEIKYSDGHFTSLSPLYYITGQHDNRSMFYVSEGKGATFKKGGVLDHVFISSNLHLSTNYKNSDNTTIIRNCTASDHFPLVLTLDIPPVKTSPVNTPKLENTPTVLKPSAEDIMNQYTTGLKSYGSFEHGSYRTFDPNDLLVIFRRVYISQEWNEDIFYCIILTENGMTQTFPCGKTITEDGSPRYVLDYAAVSTAMKIVHDYDIEHPGTIGKITHVAMCKMLINEDVTELSPTNNDMLRHELIVGNTEITNEENLLSMFSTVSRAVIFDSKKIHKLIDAKGLPIKGLSAMMIYEQNNVAV